LDLVNLLDHQRVVNNVRRAGHLPLIKKYLLHVQRENNLAVNEAVNELVLLEEDYKGLRTSIDSYRNFDQVALAEQLKNHELLEFRRISAYLNKINKRWKAAVELSKKDQLWKDAMEATAESKDTELAEELVRFFVDQKLFECFAASLFTCYELIRPDVVLELAWRNELTHFVMPYIIQTFRDYDNKLQTIFTKFDTQEEVAEQKEQQAKKKAEEHAQIAAVTQPQILAIGGPVGWAPPPGSFGAPSGGGFGGHPGGGFGGHPGGGFGGHPGGGAPGFF